LRALFLFFFFQAEDGIRDDLVTGVQTCALPILRPETAPATEPDPPPYPPGLERHHVVWIATQRRGIEAHRPLTNFLTACRRSMRSEERRVGKECRSRWSPYH